MFRSAGGFTEWENRISPVCFYNAIITFCCVKNNKMNEKKFFVDIILKKRYDDTIM